MKRPPPINYNGPTMPGMPTPCWIWLGRVNNAGYGPHRRIYKAAGHIIPPKHDLDHLCKVIRCVSPVHMEPVTRGENNRRIKNRRPRGTVLPPAKLAKAQLMISYGFTDGEIGRALQVAPGNIWSVRKGKRK